MTNNSNNTSIKRLLYSLFDEPIVVDGKDVSYRPPLSDADIWDLEGMFPLMFSAARKTSQKYK